MKRYLYGPGIEVHPWPGEAEAGDHEYKASPGCTESSGRAWSMSGDPITKRENKIQPSL